MGTLQNNRLIRKLQKACNTKYDSHLCYSITQWYSERHHREINRYVLQQQEPGPSGKSNKTELFSTYSLMQMVFFMRDYWFKLEGIPLPTDNEVWNEIRKGTVLNE